MTDIVKVEERKSILDYNDIEYTDGQKKFLLEIEEIILNFNSFESIEIMLQGYAGTGKTTLMKNIVEFFNDIKVKQNLKSLYIIAPTNKACEVLSKKLPVNSNISTIFSLLYGQPKIDNSGVYQWIPREEPISNSIIIVDEASMLTFDIVEDLRLISEKNLIIYSGDIFQLEPIGKHSNIFELDNKYELTEVKRTDNSILNLATTIRTLKRNVYCQNTKDISVLNYQPDFLKCYIEEYKENDDSVVIVATNKLRNELTTHIRRLLEFKNVLNSNEKLISIGNSNSFSNGSIFKVETFKMLERIKIFNGYDNVDIEIDLLIINDNPVILINNYDKPSLYHSTIEKCIGFEEITKYDDFCKTTLEKNIFNDFKYDEVIRDRNKLSKDVIIATYGYVISAHKGQGSEFNNVFVHQNYNAPTWNSAKWFYTAITRSNNKLWIFPNNKYQTQIEI